MYLNPTTWETLSAEKQNAVFQGHDEFQKAIVESGEMVGTKALADPSKSATVRVRGGVPASADEPYVAAEEFLCGYYVLRSAAQC
jgi:hypothetical protein